MAERRKQLVKPTTLLLACLTVVAGTPKEATIAEQRSLIQNLTAKVAQQDEQMTLLNNKMSSLESVVASLKSKNNSQDFSQMTQFNSTLNSVKSEISNLKSQDTTQKQQIAQLNNKMSSVENDVASLTSKDSSQDQQTAMLNSTLNSVQSDITRLKSKDAAHDQKMTSLQDDVTSLTSQHAILDQQLTQLKATTSHVESGDIGCSPQATSSDGRYVTQSFSTPYLSPPVVHVGVRQLASVNDNGKYDHGVTVTSVTTTHFTVYCKQYHFAEFFVLSVNWISVPK